MPVVGARQANEVLRMEKRFDIMTKDLSTSAIPVFVREAVKDLYVHVEHSPWKRILTTTKEKIRVARILTTTTVFQAYYTLVSQTIPGGFNDFMMGPRSLTAQPAQPEQRSIWSAIADA